jgi:hypothetical protein
MPIEKQRTDVFVIFFCLSSEIHTRNDESGLLRHPRTRVDNHAVVIGNNGDIALDLNSDDIIVELKKKRNLPQIIHLTQLGKSYPLIR